MDRNDEQLLARIEELLDKGHRETYVDEEHGHDERFYRVLVHRRGPTIPVTFDMVDGTYPEGDWRWVSPLPRAFALSLIGLAPFDHVLNKGYVIFYVSMIGFHAVYHHDSKYWLLCRDFRKKGGRNNG